MRVMQEARSSRVDHVQQSAVLVGESMAFPSAAGAALCGSEGIGFVVRCLVVVPATELILVLNFDARHEKTISDKG